MDSIENLKNKIINYLIESEKTTSSSTEIAKQLKENRDDVVFAISILEKEGAIKTPQNQVILDDISNHDYGNQEKKKEEAKQEPEQPEEHAQEPEIDSSEPSYEEYVIPKRQPKQQPEPTEPEQETPEKPVKPEPEPEMEESEPEPDDFQDYELDEGEEIEDSTSYEYDLEDAINKINETTDEAPELEHTDTHTQEEQEPETEPTRHESISEVEELEDEGVGWGDSKTLFERIYEEKHGKSVYDEEDEDEDEDAPPQTSVTQLNQLLSPTQPRKKDKIEIDEETKEKLKTLANFFDLHPNQILSMVIDEVYRTHRVWVVDKSKISTSNGYITVEGFNCHFISMGLRASYDTAKNIAESYREKGRTALIVISNGCDVIYEVPTGEPSPLLDNLSRVDTQYR